MFEANGKTVFGACQHHVGLFPWACPGAGSEALGLGPEGQLGNGAGKLVAGRVSSPSQHYTRAGGKAQLHGHGHQLQFGWQY